MMVDNMEMKKNNFDEKKAQKAIRLLLESFGEDLEREGLRHTPERVAEFYKETLSGNGVDSSKLVPIHYSAEEHEEIIFVKDIPLYSLCEHHLLSFFGKACVAYMPQKNKIVGVSKLVRLVEVFANRLQLQERLTKQIADTIMKSIEPHGVMVVIEAEHLCMTMRGVKKPGTKILTSAMRGVFLKDMRARAEAISLLGR
ncbi:MAG: GTP cyclohydrolase I FolE [Endomicrobium sp.]|jgi:GTP cyclohydrolase I|nr:GTP cyclohydrolase I FolE [Endomicrobium sp.]